MPFVTVPVFSLTYRATIDTFPGTFLFIVAVLCLLGSFLLFVVTWGLSKADKLRLANGNEKSEEEKALE